MRKETRKKRAADDAKAKGSAEAGGLRFSGRPPAAGGPSRVRSDDQPRDSVVVVTAEDDGGFLAKVGFLKAQHRYEIAFTLPEVPALGKDACPAAMPSARPRVVDVSPAPEGGLKVTCEYLAQREGVLCEANDDVCVVVKVHARVMGRHNGTSMHSDSARCIGAEPDRDSEQSDWRGFDRSRADDGRDRPRLATRGRRRSRLGTGADRQKGTPERDAPPPVVLHGSFSYRVGGGGGDTAR
ncbi:adipose-secreted signaling protein [Phyllopteryx taeniolatus]|uniref:adipose-secreted signaling protein n=1 Tax=Phyllopteryx taeniolatus TaxID=161469 RepID=UPI002AD5B329|nr:adipose-secreted signaling protein [Phyllopteryx taeniolatus]